MGKYQNHLLWAWKATFLLIPFNISFLIVKSEWQINFWSRLFDALRIPYSDFSSDTPELIGLTLALFLFLLALLVLIDRKGLKIQERLSPYVTTIFDWIIILVFIKYGLDKVMLLQFPEPEVNLQYTPLGEFDPDILFWSAAGSAPLFSIITGSIELVGALLLVFPKTKILGRYLLMGSLMVILLIDLSFGIHVILLVTYLLFGLVIRSWTSLKFLFHSLFGFEKIKMNQRQNRKVFFNLMAFLCLITYIYVGNEQPEITSSKWVGAYQSIDGKRQIFINKQAVWIEKTSDTRDIAYQITNAKNDLFLLKGYQNQKLVQLEDFGQYMHVKDLQSGKWNAYKKLTRY